MATKPFFATKEYGKTPFILSDRKLSRVVEVAKERFQRIHTEQEIQENYVVIFADGKELRINNLENVLKLDNSKKNPISYIKMSLEVFKDDEVVNGIIVNYDGKYSNHGLIVLSGISYDFSWLQETMGALEEQLERTIPTDLAYSISGNLSYVIVIFTMILSLFVGVIGNDQVGSLKISESHIEELNTLSRSAKTDAEKLDFVFHYLSATLDKNSYTEKIKHLIREPRTYFMGVPALVCVLSALAAVLFFYPRHVFDWGDCGEAYEKAIERRKFLWYGVVLSLVIGILAGLFTAGITS